MTDSSSHVRPPRVPSPGVAVVTGAGRGIGRAVAQRLAAGGHAVVAVARTAAEVEATAASMPDIVAVVADVGTETGIAAAAAAADGLDRPLTAWVNNAAHVERIPLDRLDAAAWDRTLDVNLRGAFLGTRAAFDRMREAGGGTIVNIASLSGLLGVEKFPGLIAYNVSKAGLAALTEAVGLEGRADGVRCVALAPGAVDTEMLRRAAPHLRPGVVPADIAELVAFLLTPAAAPLTGVVIPILSNA